MAEAFGYMRRLVLGWNKLVLERILRTRIVSYADDLVIPCRRVKPKRPCSDCARSRAG